MPRDRFDDPDTSGLFVQVNCRRDNDDGRGTPGHLQISTHDERADARISELLADGATIMAALYSAVRSGEPMIPDLEWLHGEWSWKVRTFRTELTGTYVTLDGETGRKLIKALHRGENLARPPGEARLPGALDGVRIPRAGESPAAGQLPAPGATGYPLQDSSPEPITGRPAIHKDAE
jgi:hypothetical protein